MAANANSDDETNVVSMVDVLEEEELLEQDATAVLGGSDDTNCTYAEDYVRRQALYSCKTCTSPDTQPAGVCLACCLKCHEGHDLYELYTKRNFRCDCGNSKFGDFKCKLVQDKASVNDKNKYNHNFDGQYCSCNRPYPDPDDDVEDEMIQCVVCEDWHHGRHLESELPSGDYEEMVCGGCLEKNAFLKHYVPVYSALTKSSSSMSSTCQPSEADSMVDISSMTSGTTTSLSASASDSDTRFSETSQPAEDTCPKRPVSECSDNTDTSNKRQRTEEAVEAGSSQQMSSSESDAISCRLSQLRDAHQVGAVKGAVFWKSGWRSKLCKCPSCLDQYTSLAVPFLVEEGDTISAYESDGKMKKQPTQYEQGLQALADMDRIQQVEVLQGYTDMKSQLTEYLKSFAENGKVVTQADIQSFFTRLAGAKRNQAATGMQYHCK